MFFYLYKVTNILNNRFYIGVHKTKNLNDGYMGSGKLLNQAFKKYGKLNFRKEILEYFDTWEKALFKEKEIVDEKFILREDTYNIKLGGSGGFDYINKNRLNNSTEAIEKRKNTYKEGIESGRIIRKSYFGRKHTEETKKIIGEKRKKVIETHGHNKGMLGKKHTDDHRQKMSKYFTENAFFKGVTGDDHPAGNTSWYNDGIRNYRIKKDVQVDSNWKPGKIQKKYKSVASKRLQKALGNSSEG